MQALVYHRSIPRYLLGLVLTKLCRRRFFPGVAPLNLKEVHFQPPARRLGPEWITLKTRMCGICGSDLNLIRGVESMLLEPYASFPAILGHEILAEVADAPQGSEFRPGDRVVVEPVLHCRVRGLSPCPECARGDYHLCRNYTVGPLAPGSVLGYNADVSGGMAEFLAAHPAQLVRVPDEVSDEDAVLADSLASALQPALNNFPDDEDQVLVYGAGVIGQHLIRCLRALGSKARIIVSARHPFQRDLALAGGADKVLMSPRRDDLARETGGVLLPTTVGGGNVEGGADLFFDCVGSSGTLQEGLLALKAKGRYVMVGTAGTAKADLSSLWFRELSMTGTVCYSHGRYKGEEVRTYQLAMDFLARGDYPTQGLLTHTFALNEYIKAFRTVFDKRTHQSVKGAFDFRPGQGENPSSA